MWGARGLGLHDLAADVLGEVADNAHSTWERARVAVVAAGVGAEDAALAEALELSAGLESADLWAVRERRRAAPLLARALRAGLGPAGVAERLLAACGGEVLSECAELLADAPPAARAAVARAAARAADADAVMVARLARDADAGVREAARAAQEAVARRPRPEMRITTFGALRVHRGGRALAERAIRARGMAVLASLICARGPVHRERLLEWHWPGRPVPGALAAMHTTLSELRRALEPGLPRGASSQFLVTEGESYRLALGPDDRVDAYELLALADGTAPNAEDPDAAIARLEAAVSLHDGEFLPAWPYADWAEPLRRELAGAYERALESLGERLVAAGRPRDAVAPLERLLERDPEREAACRALMRAHEGCGEPSLALRRYHLLRTALRRSGTDPGPETRALYSEILRRGDDA